MKISREEEGRVNADSHGYLSELPDTPEGDCQRQSETTAQQDVRRHIAVLGTRVVSRLARRGEAYNALRAEYYLRFLSEPKTRSRRANEGARVATFGEPRSFG
jgi:hypothetical protein